MEKRRIKIIADEFNISQPAAKKYVSMYQDEISSLDNPKDYKKRKTARDG